MIESCKGCALAAKSPTTTCKLWPKTDHPWQRIHTDFGGPVDNIAFWEVGNIKQRIGELVYIVQGQKNTQKRHMNQLRKCRLNESEESPQNTCEEPIDVIFDHISHDTPQVSPEVRRSVRKRKFTQPLDVNLKRKKY